MPWKKGNRLRAVSEQDASPEVYSVYAEIMQKLGVPRVNVLFQVYASYPGFLELHWKLFGPIVESGEFFQLAERLRADAYTRAHNYFVIANLRPQLDALHFTEGAKQELAGLIDLFAYNDPLLLLISAAQQQAFDGVIGTGHLALLPPTPGYFEKRPVLLEEESTEPDVRRVFEEFRQVYGLSMVSQDFRALARWPDFLRVYWELLQPLLASPLYRECQFGIHESAWTLARELPGTLELTLDQMTAAGMSEDDVASVVRLTQAFTRSLSSSLLNISIAKIGIEGGNHVQTVAKEKERVHSSVAGGSTPNQAA
jgi:hypothetical protein